jgi:alkanesulfonate monooxygenase SsuD/methylene tetrahydromethanopterin reductase-like flavin-dependent oxidoreductase (luciferase family)
VEYFVNYPAGGSIKPGVWATARESEGWHGVCASDHLWVGTTRYPHVFVAATQMACATSKVKITTSFCNNLFRSPVEFAQAALAIQDASDGRFEAGLGAGWLRDEIEAMGGTYPDGPGRVGRYIEALQIVRDLLRTGQCMFSGRYYQVDIRGDQQLAPLSTSPPPLIAAAGGPIALRGVTPLVDRVEIKANSRSTRVGHLDFPIMATVTEDEVREQVARVRRIDADIPLGIFILVAAGNSAAVKGMKSALGNGYLARFMGQPDEVAEHLRALGDLGINRVQLTELVPGSHSLLASHLL